MEKKRQKWTGFYTYESQSRAREKTRFPMSLELILDGGEIIGNGSDEEVGSFFIRGTYLPGENEVEFTKQYIDRHRLFYTGFLEAGYGIWGTWQTTSFHTTRPGGEFHIWRPGESETAPTPSGENKLHTHKQ